MFYIYFQCTLCNVAFNVRWYVKLSYVLTYGWAMPGTVPPMKWDNYILIYVCNNILIYLFWKLRKYILIFFKNYFWKIWNNIIKKSKKYIFLRKFQNIGLFRKFRNFIWKYSKYNSKLSKLFQSFDIFEILYFEYFEIKFRNFRNFCTFWYFRNFMQVSKISKFFISKISKLSKVWLFRNFVSKYSKKFNISKNSQENILFRFFYNIFSRFCSFHS